MEQLESTDILDKEIYEDARKKAEKTLRGADDNVASVKRKWQRKLERGIKSLQSKYDDKKKTLQAGLDSGRPLAEKRVRLSLIDALFAEAEADYLSHLDKAKAEALLKNKKDALEKESAGADNAEISLSINDIIDDMLDVHRRELAAALFEPPLLEGEIV
ncbi:MAG: hypothetical protein LBM77_06415 [Spirochaetaceae bacterium]|jgi:hypothetical protein|nr:hypothetical protein [Spirochaetaceae bacterium]